MPKAHLQLKTSSCSCFFLPGVPLAGVPLFLVTKSFEMLPGDGLVISFFGVAEVHGWLLRSRRGIFWAAGRRSGRAGLAELFCAQNWRDADCRSKAGCPFFVMPRA